MEKLLTCDDVSEILQLNIQTVFKYIRQGRLSAVKFGRSFRVTQDQLKEFIEKNKTA